MLQRSINMTGQTGQNGANAPFAPQGLDGANGATPYKGCPVPSRVPPQVLCKCEGEV